MPASLLDRYLDGDRKRVWHELKLLGTRVREAEALPDAKGVANEAMRRARGNIETIIDRLREQGYRFGEPDGDPGALQPLAPPRSAICFPASRLNSRHDSNP